MVRMIILTERLTTGQVTFILRVVVQVLGYVGLFLIGLIILGHTPRVAPLETHDVMNRIVGKSTATTSTLHWIRRRITGRSRDPTPSTFLLFALVLSLLYGLFVSLSDVGFIGLQQCDIAGAAVRDFPGSVQSEADALSIVQDNMLNGTDPASVNSYRCDSSVETRFDEKVTELVCTKWVNSTYGDPSTFRTLNSTDSAVLMNKLLSRTNHSRSRIFDLNTYFIGAPGEVQRTPIAEGGIAVVPHESGVNMFVGVPRMEPFRKATIPKLMAVEVEAGCMSLGIMGKKHVEGLLDFDADFFIPDDIHKPERREKYTGPSILIPVLEKAADTVRQIIRPLYNDSDVARNGYIASYNRSKGGFDWQTTIGQWFLPNIPGSTIDYADQTKWILGNCTHDVHNTLGVDIPSESVLQMPAACAFLNLRGSYLESGTIYQAHTQMVCATTTSVNMVSATIESNVNNSLTVEYNRLPSNIHITRASYFDIIEDRPTPGDRTFGNFPVQHRFTLSDSSNSSSLQHYIYQNHVFTASSNTLSSGSGNAGGVIPMVGAAMIGVSGTDDGSLTLVNSKYFSTQNFSTAVVTRMLGTIGASYLFNSVGYNAWAALDKESFQVEITGGKSAVCYNPPYGAAFLPLTLSAIIVLLWSLQMMISSKLRGTKKWEDMYGGMAPTIVAPTPEKPSQQEVLAWEGVGTRPHLRPVYAQSFGPQTPSSMMPMPMHYPSETEMLVKSSKTDYLG